MEPGYVIEFIENQKILCAVILEIKKQRLRLLTENNKEITISPNRLSHHETCTLKLSAGRDALVSSLKKIADHRNSLIHNIDIKELWDILYEEDEWIDLTTMTEFCFKKNPSPDEKSAIMRAFFANRIFFKFNQDKFFPNSEETVNQILSQIKEQKHKELIIIEASEWLKKALTDSNIKYPDNFEEISEILKSYYIFENESQYAKTGKEILSRTGLNSTDKLFSLFVKLGIWNKDENIDLLHLEIQTNFSQKVISYAENFLPPQTNSPDTPKRRDLTDIDVMTIDGESTLDFDDAISIEEQDNTYIVGIHITDIGHFIKKGDIIDRHALEQATSIYLPDLTINMLPPVFSENFCSLKKDKTRPAISILVKLSYFADILDFEIVPSIIKIKQQLTYSDVDNNIDKKPALSNLLHLAKQFREKRLDGDAMQISLPELNIDISDTNEVNITKTTREKPGRILISEMMIMANWLMAKFLSNNNMPAIFRSQPPPKERLFKRDQGTIFQNWMQRKLLSRAIVSSRPEHHSGLGINAYVTATSPIRKYSDLVTQRQIRAVFNYEEPYSKTEINQIIQKLPYPQSIAAKAQYSRHRYFILKFLEKKSGSTTQAIILDKRKNFHLALLCEYVLECKLSLPSGTTLKPGDLVSVTIQHVNARKDVLSIYL